MRKRSGIGCVINEKKKWCWMSDKAKIRVSCKLIADKQNIHGKEEADASYPEITSFNTCTQSHSIINLDRLNAIEYFFNPSTAADFYN